MRVLAFEGVVENGQIRLTDIVKLPDNTEVYVIAPGIKIDQIAPFHRPRFAHPEQAADFKMTVIKR